MRAVWGAAGHAHGVGTRVHDKLVTHFRARACDQVDDSLGQPCLVDALGQFDGRGGRRRRRGPTDGVAHDNRER